MHLSKNKKTSFILNTLGIDMLSISEKLDNSVQTYVHCSLRDRILTLHSHSLDEYSERELELLSRIEASVSKENKKNKEDLNPHRKHRNASTKKIIHTITLQKPKQKCETTRKTV